MIPQPPGRRLVHGLLKTGPQHRTAGGEKSGLMFNLPLLDDRRGWEIWMVWGTPVVYMNERHPVSCPGASFLVIVIHSITTVFFPRTKYQQEWDSSMIPTRVLCVHSSSPILAHTGGQDQGSCCHYYCIVSISVFGELPQHTTSKL